MDPMRAIAPLLLPATFAAAACLLAACSGPAEPPPAAADAAATAPSADAGPATGNETPRDRSEEHTSELQSLMRISYAVFCLKKKKITTTLTNNIHNTIHHNTSSIHTQTQ